MQTPLVGRELDLATALEQLKRVEAGTPASLLVRGEAGIGKSRLVAELADRARQLGHAVLAGRADDLDHGIPYAVFRDLVARNGIGPLPFLGDVQDVFNAAVELLGDTATTPTVLVLEDLHIADRDSLVLAALLVRLVDVPLLTVVTTRPGLASDLERLFDQLAFDGRGAVLDLELLDRHETQALVAAALGAAPDDPLTDAVFTSSVGNPFFAHEKTQALLDGRAVVIEDGRARLVPDAPGVGLRPSTALLRRLFLGTGDDIELAKVMAVFGRFALHDLPVVRGILDRDDASVAATFDRLVDAGVLTRTDGGYELAHPIVRDTLYEDIGPAERRRIHAAIARALSTQERDLLELAPHVAASAEAGDEAAADVLLAAGRAVASVAPLVSATYYGRALDVLPGTSSRRAEAFAAQARSLHIGARPAEAVVAGTHGLALLADGPPRDATAAIVAGDLYLCGRAEEALAVIDAELARGGARCPLLGFRTNILMQVDRLDEARATFPDALASLTDDVPPGAQLPALSHLIQYANHVGERGTAAELIERAAGLGSSGSATIALLAHELVAFADWRPGMVERVERHLASARSIRVDATALSLGGGSETARARVHHLRGEWDDALALCRSTAFDLETRDTIPIAQMLLCTAAEILLDRGDVDAASAMVAGLQTPIAPNVRNTEVVRARIERALGNVDEARRIFEEQRASALRPGASVWKLAECLRELADLTVESGGDATPLLEDLEDLAERTGWLEAHANVHRVRALVSGDADAAADYLAFAEAEAWENERAHALLVLGLLDVEPGANLAAAYRAFDALGAAPSRRRAAAALRARSLSVPRRRTDRSSTLTDTEVQLVRLVRDGLSNRQIATAMHYSPKTIEVYLSRLYVKTGFASRLELIRAVDSGALEVGGA
ncbi:MAG TPA: AAA family ATPase [Acidimicrobiales bacterium]|nr:AAA family ATPase [Acidimicrobiales bacterium]